MSQIRNTEADIPQTCGRCTTARPQSREDTEDGLALSARHTRSRKLGAMAQSDRNGLYKPPGRNAAAMSIFV